MSDTWRVPHTSLVNCYRRGEKRPCCLCEPPPEKVTLNVPRQEGKSTIPTPGVLTAISLSASQGYTYPCGHEVTRQVCPFCVALEVDGKRAGELVRKQDEGPQTFEDHVEDVYIETMGVLLRKHKDYGARNIAESPGGPLNGLRVRIWDKVARINNLIDSGAEPEHESLRDSYLDLANYSMIALLVLDGHWPKGE